RIPRALGADPVLYGECLGGALYWNDFLNLAKTAGFGDPRLVADRPLSINHERIAEKIGHIDFYSATYRLFKLDNLEANCENYGQAVVYRGGIPHHPNVFALDKHHVIKTGQVFPVCGNTWRMLCDTRFNQYFTFIGDFDTHFGLFEGCGVSMPFESGHAAEGILSVGCC
ncbi:MAG: methyltransferase type 11, partial [Gammaproteobacteria bacterium]